MNNDDSIYAIGIAVLICLLVLVVYVFNHRLNDVDRRLDRLEQVTQQTQP